MTEFVKHSGGKLRWSLLPFFALRHVVEVLEFGALKYKPGNWRNCESQIEYWDAAMRHMEAWRNLETNDPQSGLPHLAHAVCCLLFAMSLPHYTDDRLEPKYREATKESA